MGTSRAKTSLTKGGAFPTLIAIITMFLAAGVSGALSGVVGALALTGVLVLGVLCTLAASRLLSATVLKGETSSFTLELPPYRRPQFLRVLVRSVCDRTGKVLLRAVAVAAPAGLLIWVMANVSVAGGTLLSLCCNALDPFARLMGLDGVLLTAFILGSPANEIVLPLAVMAYTAQSFMPELGALSDLRTLLVQNGWTWATAVSTLLFSLLHWPCTTTLLTVYRETGGKRWTLLAALLPTAFGVIACMLFTFVVRLFR